MPAMNPPLRLTLTVAALAAAAVPAALAAIPASHGPPAAPEQARPVFADATPPAVERLASYPGDRTTRLEWTPDPTGGHADGWTITVEPADGGPYPARHLQVDGDTTTVEVDGLANDIDYAITVVGHNAHGTTADPLPLMCRPTGTGQPSAA